MCLKANLGGELVHSGYEIAFQTFQDALRVQLDLQGGYREGLIGVYPLLSRFSIWTLDLECASATSGTAPTMTTPHGLVARWRLEGGSLRPGLALPRRVALKPENQ